MGSSQFPQVGSYKFTDGTMDESYVYAIPYQPDIRGKRQPQLSERFAFFLAGLGYNRYVVHYGPGNKEAVFWAKEAQAIVDAFNNDIHLVGLSFAAAEKTTYRAYSSDDAVVGLEELPLTE